MVLQLDPDLRFPAEELAGLRVGQVLVAIGLEREHVVRALVVHEVDDSEPTFAEHPVQLVGADARARAGVGWRGGRGWRRWRSGGRSRGWRRRSAGWCGSAGWRGSAGRCVHGRAARGADHLEARAAEGTETD